MELGGPDVEIGGNLVWNCWDVWHGMVRLEVEMGERYFFDHRIQGTLKVRNFKEKLML